MLKDSGELREPWLPFGLDFVLPSVMQGFRRQVPPVLAGGDVCGVLRRSSDGWMRPPVRGPNEWAVVNNLLPQLAEFISVVCQFTTECRLCSICHAQRALRPGTTAVVRISAGLDCEAVSSLRSASFMPQTTAWCPRVASAVLQVFACSN